MGPIQSFQKMSLPQSISQILHKWRKILKKISDEANQQFDDSSESDEISVSDSNKIDSMFNHSLAVDDGKRFKSGYYAMDNRANNSGENKLHKKKSILFRMKDSTRKHNHNHNQDHPILLDSSRNSNNKLKNSDILSKQSSSNISEIKFDSFDVVEECNQMRSNMKGPFTHGETLWEIRRQLWQVDTHQDIENNPHRLKSQENRKLFQNIPEQYYHRIYKKLVLEDKPLREPLNLQDALKVINSGWTETKKWDNAAKGLG